MEQGSLVLVDTCIIIEAFRANCWKAITTYFDIQTVAKCAEEARTGNGRTPGYVEIDEKILRAGLNGIHPVSDLERATLATQLPHVDSLDDGERDLLAHAHARKDAFLIASADRAAVYAVLDLGWRDRIVSLEEAAKANGARPPLKKQYDKKWLESACADWYLKMR